ncbi:MAG TPA: hypothetical protein PLH43_09390 [Acetivibrio sp.]|uniref:hypothetical protein n=1 Tax=Acetivibrio sp. TaxID=1872092 RepID=UPI002B887CE2|nr:hypothetical protein [Acetivibrio sp.]HOM03026.1 hypothetical protein [Acetivibrio sp.]
MTHIKPDAAELKSKRGYEKGQFKLKHEVFVPDITLAELKKRVETALNVLSKGKTK